MDELQVKYVIGVEWGSDRTLVSASDRNPWFDRGQAPKIFDTEEQARAHVSSMYLSENWKNLTILKFGNNESDWTDFLDEKGKYARKEERA